MIHWLFGCTYILHKHNETKSIHTFIDFCKELAIKYFKYSKIFEDIYKYVSKCIKTRLKNMYIFAHKTSFGRAVNSPGEIKKK